jgi:hypothetical protein
VDTGEVVGRRRAVDDSDSDTDGDDPRVELASSHSSDDDFDVPDLRPASSGRRRRKTGSKHSHSRKSCCFSCASKSSSRDIRITCDFNFSSFRMLTADSPAAGSSSGEEAGKMTRNY